MDRTRRYAIRILPKIDRGFFIAEGEWTCYRRNYFQVSSGFDCIDVDTGAPVSLPCLMDMNPLLDEVSPGQSPHPHSEPKSITKFALKLSAKVASGTKDIPLVQHTPKRDKGPQMKPSLVPCAPGGNPHTFGSGNIVSPFANDNAGEGSSSGLGVSNIVTFDRCQFKTATANNGKRRASQQFYVLVLEVWGVCKAAGGRSGEETVEYKIASLESANLVVRGRSPGHYKDPIDPRLLMVEGVATAGQSASSHHIGGLGGVGLGIGMGMYHPNVSLPSPYGPPQIGNPPFMTSVMPPNPHHIHHSHRFEPYPGASGSASSSPYQQPHSPYSAYSPNSSHSGLESPMSGIEASDYPFPHQPPQQPGDQRDFVYESFGRDADAWNARDQYQQRHDDSASTSASPAPVTVSGASADFVYAHAAHEEEVRRGYGHNGNGLYSDVRQEGSMSPEVNDSTTPTKAAIS